MDNANNDSMRVYCLSEVASGLEPLRHDNPIFVMTRNNRYICDECKVAFDICGATMEIHAMKVTIDPSKSQELTFGECKKVLRQNKDHRVVTIMFTGVTLQEATSSEQRQPQLGGYDHVYTSKHSFIEWM